MRDPCAYLVGQNELKRAYWSLSQVGSLSRYENTQDKRHRTFHINTPLHFQGVYQFQDAKF
jgi:hypothetical protein